jgi:hypothetical protein
MPIASDAPFVVLVQPEKTDMRRRSKFNLG